MNADYLSDDEALALLKESADEGYIPAMYDYAQLTPSQDEQRKYLKMAADNGFIPAKHEYANLTARTSSQIITYSGSLDQDKTGLFEDKDRLFELKPNIFGIGVNVNEIIERLKRKTNRSKSE